MTMKTILKKLCEKLSIAVLILLIITMIGCWWLWLWLGLMVLLVSNIFTASANFIRNMTTLKRIACTNPASATPMAQLASER